LKSCEGQILPFGRPSFNFQQLLGRLLAAAAIQKMMPNAMRGQASAIYLFAVNLIGLGIGPSAVAWVTDYVFADESMLRYSLLIVNCVAHLASAALLAAGVRPFQRSLKQRDEWNAANA
jgi:hypothetical protein